MAHSANVSATRYVRDNATVQEKLGPLGELSGTWEGKGFNLIARPDFHDKANLYLQLNQTHETLENQSDPYQGPRTHQHMACLFPPEDRPMQWQCAANAWNGHRHLQLVCNRRTP